MRRYLKNPVTQFIFFSFFFFILILSIKKPSISKRSLGFQKNPLCQVSLGSVKTSFSWLCSSVNGLGLSPPPISLSQNLPPPLDLCLSFTHWSKTVRKLEFRMELSAEFLIRLICQVIIAFGAPGRTPLDLNLYH